MRGDFEESPAEKEGELSFLSFFSQGRGNLVARFSTERERESGRFIIVATTRFVLRFELERLVSIK